MREFEKLFNKVVIEEKSTPTKRPSRTRIEKKRSFYPRKVETVGGFSDLFLTALSQEVAKLKKRDPSIKDIHILKAIDFELRGH